MDVVFQKDRQNKKPIKEKTKGLVEKVKQFQLPSSFYYFCVLLFIGFGFYFLMLIENGFTLAYGGDFSAQYIPMGFHVWDYYHEWIKTGHFNLFDPTLYLGANSIGSNTYYGLFSPFNIIIVILPRSFVPHSIAICSIVKLACAGLFFKFYMVKSFNVKENVGRLCGIAYAFCGWGAFYLWYNNYQDILVFFPLVLWGVEKTIKQQRPWLLAVGTCLLAICNYVLMVSYLVCAFFYAMFRFFQQVKEKTAKENFIILGLGVLGFGTGLLLSFCVFFPAFMATMASPKLDGQSYGGLLKEYFFNGKYKEFFELLFSWKKAADQHNRVFPNRVYYPILEFFFPATTCRSLPTLELYNWDFDDMAVSLWCYVPFILFLVPALIQSGTEKKWSHFIGFALLVVSLFTPFMYFLTMAFTNGYARWTLFIVSSLLAYVGTYIDKIPNVAKWHIHVGFMFAITGILAAWILTWKIYTPNPTSGNQFMHRFVEKGKDYTNIAYLGELAYVTIVYLVLLFTYNKKAFNVFIACFVSIEAVVVGNLVTLGHGYDTRYNNGYYENEQFKKVLDKVKENDPSYFRTYSSINDAYSDNNSFINNYNTVAFFHSVYNFEVNDFTLWTGIRNGVKSVSGDYRGKYQDLDNLLGVKYYFISKQKSKYDAIEKYNPNGYIANVPFDFEENKEYGQIYDEMLVYENKSLNEFGYSYSSIFNADMNLYYQSGHLATRYSIVAVKNAMALSMSANVSEIDLEEIGRKHPDILVKEGSPSITSVRQMIENTNFVQTYYDLSGTKERYAQYYPFEKIPNIPYEFPTCKYEDSRLWDFFTFYTSPSGPDQPLIKAGTTLYVYAPFSGSEKYNFYFLDKDNKIFMFDSHDDDTTDNTCYIRGFYIKKDVYRIGFCGKYGESTLDTSTIRMYTENKEFYDARKAILNANPIENVKYEPDKFTFDTHYEKEQFVVSRVAYDKGWSISGKNNDTGEVFPVKVYKGNGAFIAFVAPKGNVSYTMTYMTPYLKGGYVISALSVTGFFVSLLGYHLYHEKKKPYYLDKIGRKI